MMKSEIVSPSKSKETQEISDDEVDLLSMLSDDIIISILSRLTIAAAVRTSVLCVRWRYLWTYYFGSLHFDGSLVLHEIKQCRRRYNNVSLGISSIGKDMFKRRLDQILKSLQAQTVEAFGICFNLENDSHIDNWVQFAIQKKVKKFVLNLVHGNLNSNGYELCAVPSLLKLSSLPSLQVLRLSYVNVGGEDLEYLLSSCPLLETLSVLCSKRVVSLKVCSHAKLKELEIRQCDKLNTIEISAENLMSFTYYGGTRDKVSINYEHTPNLEKVYFGGSNVDSCFTDFFHLTNCYRSSYLKVLKLEILMIYSWCKYQLPENVVLANLHHLELSIDIMDNNYYYFCVSLMNRCPSLCSLILKTILVLDPPARFEMKNAYDRLKEVKIVYFSGKTSEVSFIQYIIENATNLKKLLVGPITPMISRFAYEYKTGVSANQARICTQDLLAPFIPPCVEFVIL